jgi:D-3-phosphoglycerate dehydrogenase / 2-oxoglutarate reductase
MKRITGIGGIFFKSDSPEKLYEWYENHFGIRQDYDYGRFAWIMDPDGNRIELWEPRKERKS